MGHPWSLSVKSNSNKRPNHASSSHGAVSQAGERTMLTQDIRLSVLAISDPNGFTFQCLEYDIAAQGRTFHDAKKAFTDTVAAQILLDLDQQRNPFQGLKQAPQWYWDRYGDGEAFQMTGIPIPMPDNAVPPQVRAAIDHMVLCSA